jgi:uncharacterized membrane protein YraQ (UPF0718 family)
VTALVQTLKSLPQLRIERAWLASILLLLLVGLADPEAFLPTVGFTAEALLHTLPFMAFAVLAVAYLKASGAEVLVAKAFEGRETRMIFLAALFGGLAPFCSCEVIPFVAGLLALGTPISAVVAFWLASPLIDPASLLITASALGWPFAIGKTLAAVGIGLFGGFAIMALVRAGWFLEPLRPQKSGCGCCCSAARPFEGRPVWRFWEEPARRERFGAEALSNGYFLLKWLTLAYVLESLMVRYVPADAIAGVVGGGGLGAVMLGALVGAPAYLNSFAAPPLVAGLMAQGMGPGPAMAFMVAGAVSCIPAMTAVYALVRVQLFAAYVLLGFAGAVLAGLAFGAAQSLI